MHGVLAAYPGWLVTEQSGTRLTADLDFGAQPRLLASFPFPHILTVDVTLNNRALTVETTVTPTTAASVPLCYGFHPYLTIPGCAARAVDAPDTTVAPPAGGRPGHPDRGRRGLAGQLRAVGRQDVR